MTLCFSFTCFACGTENRLECSLAQTKFLFVVFGGLEIAFPLEERPFPHSEPGGISLLDFSILDAGKILTAISGKETFWEG